MPRYLIKVPHGPSKQACEQAMRIFMETGSHFLSQADWGCPDDEHYAWLVAELEDKEQARNIVPPLFRAEAQVIEVGRLDRETWERAQELHPE